MAAPYIVLQSGFLTTPTPKLVIPNSVIPETTNTYLKLGKAIKEVQSPFAFHGEINTLFDTYTQDNRILKDFDFRERLMAELKEVLDAKDFISWCQLQYDSRHYSRLHSEFLKDTLDFIETGSRRRDNDSWLFIIEARPQASHADIDELDYQHYQGWKKNLSDTIVQWTMHRDGFRDMLYFAKIVFGKTLSRRVM